MPIQINHVNSGWVGANPMSPWHTLKVVGGITFAVALCLSVMDLIASSEIDMPPSRRLEDLLPPGKEKEPGALFPLTTNDITGFFFATLGLLVAAGGGIGGGGFLVPIYILILGFTPKHAIPLSNVTVFGGAVANTLLNIPKRHPLADRPLVDWDIIVLMEPLTVAGALFGANLNKLLPEKAIVILLVALLIFTAHKTLDKACQLYRQESLGLRKISSFSGPTESETDESTGEHISDGHTVMSSPDHSPCKGRQCTSHGDSSDDLELIHKMESECTEPSSSSSCQDRLLGKEVHFSLPSYGSASLKQRCEDMGLMEEGFKTETNHRDLLTTILEDERKTPTWNVKVIVWMFLIVLAINVLKGGGSFRSILGIKCGSLGFWVAQMTVLACTLVATLMARRRVLEKARLRDQAKYMYLPCDIQWNEHTTILYPVLSAASGLVAGMFGVGGGIVKGPLMLALGVHPAVTGATSACMILFTSFTATTSFAVFGLLVHEYAALCAIVGFVATIAGQTIMNYLLNKFQRNSYIAFSIGGVVALSAVCMTIEAVVRMQEGGPSHAPCGICST